MKPWLKKMRPFPPAKAKCERKGAVPYIIAIASQVKQTQSKLRDHKGKTAR